MSTIQKHFIVHTVAEQDIQVTAIVKGKTVMARVPGIVAEIVDMVDTRSHTYSFDEDLDRVRELLVPGQELTVTLSRKSGSPTLEADDADPEAAQKYMTPALTEADKTESQRKDEAKQLGEIKSGKADPITQPKK
jgi:hypothetical protein